jgi:(1->4)-alpha-D-glucan 1-alpha-D-glucosylmutase
VADPAVVDAVAAFGADMVAGPARAGVLGQKLVQLTLPGVPDVYQGTEVVDLSLVDPDNRRPVDFAGRRERLARLDAGARPGDLDDEKLLVTSRALRLRREHPGWFVGEDATYAAVPTSTGNAVAFSRGDADGPAVVTLATRLPVSLARLGGWGANTVVLPGGSWHDELTGRKVATGDGGSVQLADVLADLPVALLVRD